MPQKIRVMLVDDSAVIRGMYDRTLSADGAFEVVRQVVAWVNALPAPAADAARR